MKPSSEFMHDSARVSYSDLIQLIAELRISQGQQFNYGESRLEAEFTCSPDEISILRES